MHKLNSSKIVGKDFFEKPGRAGAARLEYVYNRLTGTLPSTINFSDEFDISCLEVIKNNFEQLCVDITKVKEREIEEGVWIGKDGTPYEGIFLGVSFRTRAGDSVSTPEHLVFNRSTDPKSRLMEEMYVSIKAAGRDKEHLSKMQDLLKDHTVKDKSKIYLLVSQYGDLSFTALPMPAAESDLALNYGESFLDFHENMVKSLNDVCSGLYLFYGEPGTGKSSYIKHLLTGEVKRKVAYIPIGLIDQLTSPDLLPLLMDNKDIILVMEDAEKALLSREISEANATLVSAILNLTDGFIGQAMNISIIATFNTAKDKIDEALLRKGRLKMSYEFQKLAKADARKLAESIGLDTALVNGPMSLADIYYLHDDTGYKAKEERRVGFNQS